MQLVDKNPRGPFFTNKWSTNFVRVRKSIDVFRCPFWISDSYLTQELDSSGRVISSSKRPLPTQDNITYRPKHSTQTFMIQRDWNPRSQQPSGLDLRLRPRCHRYRMEHLLTDLLFCSSSIAIKPIPHLQSALKGFCICFH
jgi:hypothetical protein